MTYDVIFSQVFPMEVQLGMESKQPQGRDIEPEVVGDRKVFVVQSLSSGWGTKRWFARMVWGAKAGHQKVRKVVPDRPESLSRVCLLYTSDAADD